MKLLALLFLLPMAGCITLHLHHEKLILCLALAGCTTTTITKPDGSIVKTTSQDPAVITAIAAGVTTGITNAAIAAINKNGFAK